MRENRDRARQTKFNEKELCRTTPVATGAVNLARYAVEARQHSWLGELCICTNRLLRCVTKRYAPTDARRIEHRTPPDQGVTLSFIELLTAGAAGTMLL
jgi:hypothetical protein